MAFKRLSNLFNKVFLDEINRMFDELFKGAGISKGSVDNDGLKDGSVSKSKMQDRSVGLSNIIQKNVGTDHANFIMQAPETNQENIFDLLSSDVLHGQFYNDAGFLTTNKDYSSTPKYLCADGDYFVSGKVNAYTSSYGAAFDMNGKWLSVVRQEGGRWKIPVGINAYYFRVAYLKSWEEELMVTKNKALPSKYVPYIQFLSSKLAINDESLIGKKDWVFGTESFKKSSVDSTILKKGSVDNDGLKDGSVSKSKMQDRSVGLSNIIQKNVATDHANFIMQVPEEYQENLFDKLSSDILRGKFYNDAGNLTTQNNYSSTPKYLCTDGDYFVIGRINAFTPTYGAVFDENGKWLSVARQDGGRWKIPAGINAYYFRVAYLNDWEEELMVTKNKALPSKYVPCIQFLDPNISIFDESLGKKDWIFGENQMSFILEDFTLNLFNKNDKDVMDGRVINMNGYWTNLADYSYSGFIPVSKNDVMYKNSNGYGGFFDADKNWIVGVNQTGTNSLVVPDNDSIAYVRTAFLTKDKGNFMVLKNKALPITYLPFSYKRLSSSIKISQSSIVDDGTTSSKRKIYGFGDSISTTIYTKTPYWQLINRDSKEVELNVNAVSGSRISKRTDRTDSLNERYKTVPANMYAVYVFMGTNDASASVPIGENDSTDETTFKGSLNIAIQYWMKFNPKMQIFFITPIQREKNLNGNLKKYNQAIQEICEKYGIKCLDGMKNSFYNTDPEVKAALSPDGLHPNDDGQAYIKNGFQKFIESI